MVRTQRMLEVGPTDAEDLAPDVLESTVNSSPDGVSFRDWAAEQAREYVAREASRAAKVAQAKKVDFSDYGEPEDVRWYVDFGDE